MLAFVRFMTEWLAPSMWPKGILPFVPKPDQSGSGSSPERRAGLKPAKRTKLFISKT
jgi:hypothetical protein